MLERIAEGLWTVARPLTILGVVTLASRMTVARLGDGGLLVHSPVALGGGLKGALDALGPVRHVVAPNRMHHAFCGECVAAYPEARLWGAPGVAAKRPGLAFAGELGGAPDAAWADVLDQAVVGGIPMLNEVAFLHRPSGTLVLTDLAANGAPDDPPAQRLWARANRAYGRLASPLELRLLLRDRAAARRGIDRVLGWGFDRVVVGHGALVAGDGKRLAREAFAWI
jgi:hypothetical protein